MARPRRSGKKKEKKNVPVGVAHIKATFNNTIITFTDTSGNVISWASCRWRRFQGLRKSLRSPPRSLPKPQPAGPRRTACAPWAST